MAEIRERHGRFGNRALIAGNLFFRSVWLRRADVGNVNRVGRALHENIPAARDAARVIAAVVNQKQLPVAVGGRAVERRKSRSGRRAARRGRGKRVVRLEIRRFESAARESRAVGQRSRRRVAEKQIQIRHRRRAADVRHQNDFSTVRRDQQQIDVVGRIMAEIKQRNLHARDQSFVIRQGYFRRIRRSRAGIRNRNRVRVDAGDGVRDLHVVNPPAGSGFHRVGRDAPAKAYALTVGARRKSSFRRDITGLLSRPGAPARQRAGDQRRIVTAALEHAASRDDIRKSSAVDADFQNAAVKFKIGLVKMPEN